VEYLGQMEGGEPSYENGLRFLNQATIAATGKPMNGEPESDGTIHAQDGFGRVPPRGSRIFVNPMGGAEVMPPGQTPWQAQQLHGYDIPKMQPTGPAPGPRPPAGSAPINPTPFEPNKPGRARSAWQGLRKAINPANPTTMTDLGQGAKKVASGVRKVAKPLAKAAWYIPVGTGIYNSMPNRTPTDDYYERFGWEDPTPGRRMDDEGPFINNDWQDPLVRGAGVISNIAADVADAGLSIPQFMQYGTDWDKYTSVRDDWADVKRKREAAADERTLNQKLARQDTFVANSGYTPEQWARGEVPETVQAALAEEMEKPFVDGDPGLNEAAAAAAATVTEPPPPPPTWVSPQGMRLTDEVEGPPVEGDASIARFLAQQGRDADTFGPYPVNAGNLREIPGAPDTQYAGRYGGQEVLATEGEFGEPTFTGLRTPAGIAAAEAERAAANVPKSNEQAIREQFNRLAELPTRTTDQLSTMTSLGNQLAMIEQTRGSGAKADYSLQEMRDEFAATSMFNDPETGDFNDEMFKQFIDYVGAELANQEDPININELRPEERMVLAAQFDRVLPVSRRLNRAVQRNTGVTPDALFLPRDVPNTADRRDAEFWRDLGWFNPGSDVGFVDALRGAPVYDVNIPYTKDKLTVTEDDLGFGNLRRREFYDRR
jgi:hypothetical protein